MTINDKIDFINWIEQHKSAHLKYSTRDFVTRACITNDDFKSLSNDYPDLQKFRELVNATVYKKHHSVRINGNVVNTYVFYSLKEIEQGLDSHEK